MPTQADAAPADLARAVSLHEAGRLHEAETIYRALLVSRPQDPVVRNLLGLVAYQAGQPDAASALHRSAIAVAPAIADFHNNLGLANAASIRTAEAATGFRRAAVLQPDLAFAWLNLASATPDPATRRRSLRRGLTLAPANPDAVLALAVSLADIGQVEIAEQSALRRQALLGRRSRARLLRIATVPEVTSSGRGRPAMSLAESFEATAGLGSPVRIPLRVTVLDDAAVGGDGLPILDDAVLLQDSIADLEALPFVSDFVTPLGERHLASHHPPTSAGRLREALLLGGGPNYYHWIADYLPRLMACEALGYTGPILVGRNLTPVQIETIARVGIDAASLVPLPDTPVRVDRLLVPSVATRLTIMHPAAIEWLRGKVLVRPAASVRRRVYISRRKATQRRVVNEPDLIRALLPLGFEIVELETMTFDRQVELFGSASIVAGPHGAGFANLVFSSSPCRVIEIDVAGSSRSFYSSISAALGLDHHRVSARATAPHALQQSDIVLAAADIDRIVALVRAQ